MPDDRDRITLDLPADERPQPLMAFDPRCHDLARVFLEDEVDVDEADADRLAARIQASVEDWLEERRAYVQAGRPLVRR